MGYYLLRKLKYFFYLIFNVWFLLCFVCIMMMSGSRSSWKPGTLAFRNKPAEIERKIYCKQRLVNDLNNFTLNV